ncbi:MAG: hypothetical protein RL026_1170 [Pseudomonadota bacterium]
MSQDNAASSVADLSYLRRLAVAGQDAPLTAGPYLVAGGGWFAAASIVQWPPTRDLLGLLLGLSPQQLMLAWLVAMAGFAVHLAVLLRRDRGRAENHSNRAINAVWSGIGIAIFAFWLGIALMAWRRGDGFLMNSINLQVLSLYAVGWIVAAAMTGQRWMHVNAWVALAAVPVLGLLVGTGHEYAVYAIALVLTAVRPGHRLMRAAALGMGPAEARG